MIKKHKNIWKIAILVAAIVALIAAAVFFRQPHKLTGRDSILIADFVNTTGDGVFDDTLKKALSVDLRQSPYLNIVGDERVRQTPKMMGRSPDERL